MYVQCTRYVYIEEFWASGPLFLPHKSPAALITLRSTLTPEINRSHRVDLRKIESASLRGLFFEIFTLQCCSRARQDFTHAERVNHSVILFIWNYVIIKMIIGAGMAMYCRVSFMT